MCPALDPDFTDIGRASALGALVLSGGCRGLRLGVAVRDDERVRSRVSQQLLRLGEVEAGVYRAVDHLHGHGLERGQRLLVVDTRLREHN